MTKINAKIIADSVDPRGHRLVSFIITFPRYILAELNTHRMLSKNSASSRAIPFEKLLKSVEENPFIPIAWQKEHKGMQGSDYFTESEAYWNNDKWLKARDYAVKMATLMNEGDITKQLCNRLLEPFMWHTVLISGTEWENFFALRCPQYEYSVAKFRSRKDLAKTTVHAEDWTDLDWRKLNKGMADIHMMDLAEAMWDAYNESKPKQLKGGDWHIPFGDDILIPWKEGSNLESNTMETVKIATARCARVSYTVVGEEKKQSFEADIKLHDRFFDQRPFHASPFEHCAKVMNDSEYELYSDERFKGGDNYGNALPKETGWCKNYRGFIQYRAMFDFENVSQPTYSPNLKDQSERF
jgi:thymidylate synthase ThyX